MWVGVFAAGTRRVWRRHASISFDSVWRPGHCRVARPCAIGTAQESLVIAMRAFRKGLLVLSEIGAVPCFIRAAAGKIFPERRARLKKLSATGRASAHGPARTQVASFKCGPRPSAPKRIGRCSGVAGSGKRGGPWVAGLPFCTPRSRHLASMDGLCRDVWRGTGSRMRGRHGQ